MKLYIIAGEASGDLHGSNLLKALYRKMPDLTCRAWGGDLMSAAGAEVVKHYRDLAFMGFVEVVKNLRTIMGNLDFCKKDILAFQPDALVLIDYPGFNLRIAKWAKQKGIKVIYYISPQIWAWHTSRVHAIRRDVDEMLVILPFEQAFYQQYDVAATFVGHPLLDVLPATTATGDAKTIALLPGSRKQEVQRILPVMLSVTPFFPQYTFEIAAASSLSDTYFEPFLRAYPSVKIVRGQTYDLLARARAALVKSGTSTLETALIGTPEVVCYTGSPISYAIARRVIKVKYISLVNLIMDQPLIAELIQHEFNTETTRQALERLLDPTEAARLKAGYAELRHRLGDTGASDKAAQAILDAVSQ